MATRGAFISGSLGAAAGLALLRAPARAAPDTIFVMVYLAGGIDGFNTVVPLYQYGTYVDRRTNEFGSIAVTQAAIAAARTAFDAAVATPAEKASQFAFHPRMSGLRALYGGGKVAVIFGAGIASSTLASGDPDRLSHDVGTFDWSTATTRQLSEGAPGWLAAAMDQLDVPVGELPPMVSVAGQLPALFHGNKSLPLVVASPLEQFTYSGVGGPTTELTLQTLDGLATGEPSSDFAASVAGNALTYVGRIGALARGGPPPDYATIAQPGYRPPEGGRAPISVQLEQVARLIAKGTPVRAYWATQFSYDTHRTQDLTHPQLVADLSNAIYQFFTWLAARRVAERVVLVTYSDFGRRPTVNSSLGTDHGTANVVFAVGDRVRGGVYGEYPSLSPSTFDQFGNTQVPVDFRNVVAPVIAGLGVDPARVLLEPYVTKPLEFLNT